MAGDKPLALDAELVQLRVAAQLAYFHVTDAVRQVDSHEELEQIVPLVAIALSTVAPIHCVADDGTSRELDGREVRARLYLKPGVPPPGLEDLAIRRGDLRRAMTTLKEARVLFGRPK